jgi:hypothetical protein
MEDHVEYSLLCRDLFYARYSRSWKTMFAVAVPASKVLNACAASGYAVNVPMVTDVGTLTKLTQIDPRVLNVSLALGVVMGTVRHTMRQEVDTLVSCRKTTFSEY